MEKAVEYITIVAVPLILALLVVVLILAITASPPTSSVGILKFKDLTTSLNSLTKVDVLVKYRYKLANKPEFSAFRDTIKNKFKETLNATAQEWNYVLRDTVNFLYDNLEVNGLSALLRVSGEESIVYTRGFISPIEDF